MLSDFVTLAPGDWVIQDAANSAVGGYVIQLAKLRGFKTVSVVRRESAVAAVQAMGGEVVLVDGPDLAKRVAAATEKAPIMLAIDAVGGASTDHLADCLAPGGTIANVGVHGTKVALHLERLWDRNITITTRLVDTVSTPMLLKAVAARKLDPRRLITHHFKLDDILNAYETFANAGDTRALKVLIEI